MYTVKTLIIDAVVGPVPVIWHGLSPFKPSIDIMHVGCIMTILGRWVHTLYHTWADASKFTEMGLNTWLII